MQSMRIMTETFVTLRISLRARSDMLQMCLFIPLERPAPRRVLM